MTEIVTVATSLTAIRSALADARTALARLAGNTTCFEGDVSTIDRGLTFAEIAAANLERLHAERQAAVDEALKVAASNDQLRRELALSEAAANGRLEGELDDARCRLSDAQERIAELEGGAS